MTSGSRLEKVSLLRSVAGFHDVRACSGVFQAPSYCSPGPPWQWGGRCLGRFLERLLSEVFAWRWHLPSWSDEVDRLASPLYRPMAHSRLPRGQGLPVRRCLVLSWWWSAIFFLGKQSFARCYWLEVMSSLVPAHGISHSKMGFYQGYLPPGKVMMLFRCVP
jgi:hypothetical protein